MFVAEVRFLGAWFAFTAAILIAGFLAITIDTAAHLPPALGAGIFALLTCTFGFIGAWLWLRRLWAANATRAVATDSANLSAPSNPARYSPPIISAAILIFDAYCIVTWLPQLNASHWAHGGDSFALLCMSSAFIVAMTLREWRQKHKNRNGMPGVIPAFTRRRLEQFAAAAELPTRAERRLAIRPLVWRGYVRLALFAVEFVLFVIFAPSIGVISALLGSLALVGGTFLLLHRLVDL